MHVIYQKVNDNGEKIEEHIQHFTDSMNEQGYRFPSQKKGARLFADVQFPLRMNVADIGRMTILAKYMIADTNRLGRRSGNQIKPYSWQEVAKLVGIDSAKRGREFIRRMLDLRMMKLFKVGNESYFIINPAYFMASGQRLSLSLFMEFQPELTPILPKWVVFDFLKQAEHKPYLTSKQTTEARQRKKPLVRL